MMRLTKSASAAIGAVVVAGCIGLAVPASAAAAPVRAAAGPVATAVSPGCVDVTKLGRNVFPYVEVKNNCSTTQRVKAIWAWGPDSSCNVLKPGQSFRDSSGGAAKFDGLRKC